MRDSKLMMRVRPETRAKIEHIAIAKRWTKTEAIDASADALLKAEGLTVPDASTLTAKPSKARVRRRRPAAA